MSTFNLFSLVLMIFRIFFGVDGGKTIACDKDSDCQDQTSDDGGVGLSCAKSADPAICGAKLCFTGHAS